MDRVARIVGHIEASKEANVIAGPEKAETIHPNAWGYKDTAFAMSDGGEFSLSGNRYLYSGKKFPTFYTFIQRFGVNKDIRTPPGEMHEPKAGVRNAFFENAVRDQLPRCALSLSPKERILASHGHTVQEVWALRFGQLARVVDAVLYPTCHQEVVSIVGLASLHKVVLLPYGGGTTVSHSLLCDPQETRMIVAVATGKMNRVLAIDRETMTVRAQAGCVGSHLEKTLNAEGLTLGHEPDSWEFSTVGGWVATRASGMKKNMYGNIEDILVDVKLVTPVGEVTRNTNGIPRISAGPDLLQMVLGSEGMFGVVTEAVLKVRPAPELKKFGSLVFPDFAHGLAFLREVARRRMQPASIRLMDNLQFQLGSALKPEQGWGKNLLDQIVKFYVVNLKKFNPDEIVAVTLSFEGAKSEVDHQEKALIDLGKKFMGISGGPENGIRGYFLTFVIAYLRDFGLQHQFIAESFETSVPWDKVDTVIRETKLQVIADCKAAGVQFEPMISARVTQTYDSGAAVYFYLGISWKGLSDPPAVYSHIEDRARECVMRHGGSISHHHGVGKIRKRFMDQAVGQTGKAMIGGLKKALDPHNVFANGNLV